MAAVVIAPSSTHQATKSVGRAAVLSFFQIGTTVRAGTIRISAVGSEMGAIMGLSRSRWAAIGAAVAVSLGAGGIGLVQATVSSGEKAVYVPITPCRLVDTRAGETNLGPRATPLGAGETQVFAVRGTNGQCTIPAGATAIVANVTAVSPTAPSFMTLWPSDQAKPNASSLNYFSDVQPVFPNGVTVRLSADGNVSAFNAAGSVDLLIDVAGYYEDHNHDDRYYTKAEIDTAIANNPGPQGEPGEPGAQGVQGAQGEQGPAGAKEVNFTFQSTVSAVFNQGGGLPAGIAVDDTVRFGLDIPVEEATITTPTGFECIGAVCDAWTFPTVPYVLSYSSGYTQFGQVDRIEITDGAGDIPAWDRINFYNGNTQVYEVMDFGGWYNAALTDDLNLAFLDIAQPGRFDLTFYWGNWGNWGTYHYDYTKPQVTTIVTRSP
jgi:hypothetical protein